MTRTRIGLACITVATVAKAKPMTLSSWKSPTEALLKTPGGELWTTVPTIGKFEIPKSTE